jgi:hypothetical protein
VGIQSRHHGRRTDAEWENWPTPWARKAGNGKPGGSGLKPGAHDLRYQNQKGAKMKLRLRPAPMQPTDKGPARNKIEIKPVLEQEDSARDGGGRIKHQAVPVEIGTRVIL